MKAQLTQEKQRAPGAGAAYVLGAKQETPGVFYIAFIVTKNPHRDYMTVTGEGIYFRHEVSPTSVTPGRAQASLGGEK